jgi:uncharacterized damage-inducible protein DinB
VGVSNQVGRTFTGRDSCSPESLVIGMQHEAERREPSWNLPSSVPALVVRRAHSPKAAVRPETDDAAKKIRVRRDTVVDDLIDDRREEPGFVLAERPMLEGWLEFHRVTLLLKCEGLTDQQRKSRPVATSNLSLHGLVRHMAEVERNWFRRVLLGESIRPIWYDPTVQDSELVPLDSATWDEDMIVWMAECEEGRRSAAAHGLDDAGIRRGQPCSLRWIYNHMIEEYARHNGHADLLRELIDGEVGC